MEENKAIIILVFVTIASIILTDAIYEHLIVADSEELNMYLVVGNHVGFNVDTNALFFGTTLKGGMASRDITVTNDFNTTLKVDIHAFGELSNWVYVSNNNFLLQPKENQTVKVTAIVPMDADFGNYTGVLNIDFRKI